MTPAQHVWVTLSPEDIARADEIARFRRWNAAHSHYRPAFGAPPELQLDINGARGELAGYLWLAPILWHGGTDPGFHDGKKVPDYELRGRYPLEIDAKSVTDPTRRLLVLPNADPGWVYLLVDGSAHPRHRIVGWAVGKEVMLPGYWQRPAVGRPGAYFVPRDDPALRPPATLLDAVRRRQFVGRDGKGRFLHYCWCGEWGSFGCSGQWYCREHLPAL